MNKHKRDNIIAWVVVLGAVALLFVGADYIGSNAKEETKNALEYIFLGGIVGFLIGLWVANSRSEE